jgi:hypothetical protein
MQVENPAAIRAIASHVHLLNNKQYSGGISMAKPIDIGLVPEKEDTRAFQKYLERPTFTREGLKPDT